MTCHDSTCDKDSGDLQFCEEHRCLGLTADGDRCKSHRNCNVPHKSKMSTLTCARCKMVFAFAPEKFKEQAEAFCAHKGVCKRCR